MKRSAVVMGPDGSYRWTHTFGGPDLNDKGLGVVTDPDGNVYVTGRFVGTVDFDVRGAGDVREADFVDIFVTSRAPDGAYRWTDTIGGPGGDTGEAITFEETTPRCSLQVFFRGR